MAASLIDQGAVTRPPSTREPLNILLVDDQPARLMSYESVLGDLGHNLVSARSGMEALEKLMKDDFAVVLLDVSMPGMDGFETAALIHQHPRFERTPIIFVTGVHITELDFVKGYKVGAVDYVSIPVVPEILRSKVAVLIELHSQRLELHKLNRSLEEANARLEMANSLLEAEKARELEALNGTLQSANEELAHSNLALQGQIVERNRVEQALVDANRHKDEFLAMLAHELRNPLAPIRYAVDIMSRFPLENPKLIWSRDAIERQVVHLTRLVDDLLDVSRITRGTINLAREPLDVRDVVTRAVETNHPLLTARHQQLSVDQPAGPVPIEGDMTRLTQVLGNLLNNAAKYTPIGGRIAVCVRVLPQHVEIAVSDNGIGIAPQSIPLLFSLFSQLNRDAAAANGGLGIGLALVRRLVEMHGGSVAALSEGVDQGSTFTIRLPLLERAAPAALADAVPEAIAAPTPRRRILVADDNRDALESLAILLEWAGHEVHKANDGAEAFEGIRQWRPDLAVLDIGMPKLSGYEVAQQVRAQDWGSDLRLVALSGWGQKEDMQRSDESGFDLHLVKPVSFETVDEMLAKLLPV